jgi:hypothetical protein
MRVMVLADENVIFIDGKGKYLDCTPLRGRQVSQIDWYGDRGEVEFASGARRPFRHIDKFQAIGGFTLKGLIDSAKPFGKWR